jgi:ADP-heptose:LPS heptosyltransferase
VPGAGPAPLLDPATKTIALVRPRVGLGDLLCSLPALEALRRARPDVHVSLVTWPETAPVVDRMRHVIDELIAFPGYPGIPERGHDPAAWAPFAASMRGRRFDLVVQAYGDLPAANEVTEALATRAVGGFVAAGYTLSRPGAWLRYPADVHEIVRHLRLAARLGADVGPGDEAPRWAEWPCDVAEWRAIAAFAGLRAAGYAVIHPGATSASRRWPPARFGAVAAGLARRGLTIVVTGTSGEQRLAAAVAAACPAGAVPLAGRTSLGGFAALLRRAAVVVSNDTGTAHLAAAVGTPSVTVFLSGDPVRWAYGGLHRAVWRDVGCNPCPHLTCPIDFRCAQQVEVSDVMAAARAAARDPLPGSDPPAAAELAGRRTPGPGRASQDHRGLGGHPGRGELGGRP